MPIDTQTESAPTSARPGSRGAVPLLLTWGVTLFLLLVILVTILYARSRGQDETPEAERKLANVETQEVTAREYRESLILPARLEADHEAAVASELAGRLDAWQVEEGAAVTAGQVVAVINTDQLAAERERLVVARTVSERLVDVAVAGLDVARVALAQARQDLAAVDVDEDSARADLELARRDFERVRMLADEEIATESDLDTAANGLRQAELGLERVASSRARATIDVQAAEARQGQATVALALERGRLKEIDSQIAALDVTLSKARIEAPCDGRFEERIVEEGEVVSAGQLLGTVYDLRYLKAAVDVPDRYVPFLDTGNERIADYLAAAMPGAIADVRASVSIPGLPRLTGGAHVGIRFDAEVVRVAQAADVTSNTFRVELRFENPGEALRQGILGEAGIDFLIYPDAIVVPMAAVQVSDAGPRVLVVEPDGDGGHTARTRDIEPVSLRGSEMLVRRGLEAGEHLIVSGGKGVLDGEPVSVILADGAVRGNGAGGVGAAPFLDVPPDPASGAEGSTTQP